MEYILILKRLFTYIYIHILAVHIIEKIVHTKWYDEYESCTIMVFINYGIYSTLICMLKYKMFGAYKPYHIRMLVLTYDN